MLLAIRQRFSLGECRITPAAREHLAAAGVAEGELIARRAAGGRRAPCGIVLACYVAGA